MYPKKFIEIVLIKETKDIHLNHPYISFVLMAVGIEFLGKCIDTKIKEWNKGKPKPLFENAINQLHAFDKYKSYINTHRFWDSFRNGCAHSFSPKSKITFSSGKGGYQNLKLHGKDDSKLNLKCEDFFIDFEAACNEVINMPFASHDDKMNKEFIYISYNKSSFTLPDFSGTTN